jgi:hypothetical protein
MKKRWLTEAEVIKIHASPMSAQKLATLYGVARQTIWAIKIGKSHKHLKLGPTAKYRELATDRLLGLPHRRIDEEIITHRQIVEDGDWDA